MGVSGRLFDSLSRVGDRIGDRRGGVLVMVLWVLVLIVFLAAQHAAHNRDKASVAMDAHRRLQREETVRSIVELFRSAKAPVVADVQTKWMLLNLNDRDVWVRWEKEDKRVRIDAGSEGKLREMIRNLLERRHPDLSEKEGLLQGDELTDALMDWVDADDLVRLNGAEADTYIEQGLSYVPSNAPFRTMSEMLLVIGMTEELFWGEPIAGLLEDLRQTAEKAGLRWDGAAEFSSMRSGNNRSRLDTDSTERVPDFWDAVTIYNKDVHRLTMIGTESDGGYWMTVVFLQAAKSGGTLQVIEEIGLRFASNAYAPLLGNLLQAGLDSRNPLWKRYVVYEPSNHR